MIRPRASASGYSKSVGALLDAGADEKVKLRGKTAYDMASESVTARVCETMRAIGRGTRRPSSKQ